MNKTVRKVMVLGGGEISRLTAGMLEKTYQLTVVEKDKENCKLLLETLTHSLVIKGDPTNFEVLIEEGLAEMDALICLLSNSVSNIIYIFMFEDLVVFMSS